MAKYNFPDGQTIKADNIAAAKKLHNTPKPKSKAK